MKRFIGCGYLTDTTGEGFEDFWLAHVVNGVYDDSFIFSEGLKFFVDDGVLNLPVELKRVNGIFECKALKLKSFKNFPKYIENDFKCSLNMFESLEFCPEYVGGDFWIIGNKDKEFTESEIRAVCEVKGEVIIK